MTLKELRQLLKKGMTDGEVLQYARTKGYNYLELDDIKIAKKIVWRRK
jgi:hypothetical protein